MPQVNVTASVLRTAVSSITWRLLTGFSPIWASVAPMRARSDAVSRRRGRSGRTDPIGANAVLAGNSNPAQRIGQREEKARRREHRDGEERGPKGVGDVGLN